jgi:hypothetical protein
MAGLGFGCGMASLWIVLWNHAVQKVVESSVALIRQANVCLFMASLLYFARYAIHEHYSRHMA